MKLTYPTFDDYLQQACFDALDLPLKDEWEGQYENWLADLDGEEYVELAEEWMNYTKRELFNGFSDGLSELYNSTEKVMRDSLNRSGAKMIEEFVNNKSK